MAAPAGPRRRAAGRGAGPAQAAGAARGGARPRPAGGSPQAPRGAPPPPLPAARAPAQRARGELDDDLGRVAARVADETDGAARAHDEVAAQLPVVARAEHDRVARERGRERVAQARKAVGSERGRGARLGRGRRVLHLAASTYCAC